MSVCERKAHSLIELKILIALLVVGVTKRGKKIIVVKVTSLFHYYFDHCSVHRISTALTRIYTSKIAKPSDHCNA